MHNCWMCRGANRNCLRIIFIFFKTFFLLPNYRPHPHGFIGKAFSRGHGMVSRSYTFNEPHLVENHRILQQLIILRKAFMPGECEL